MDTEPKYRNDPLLEVELTGAAEWDDGDNDRATHPLNEDVPVDGFVHILFRDPDDPQGGRDKDGRWYAGSFPFRSERKDSHPWAAYPDKPNGENHPVWKWTNPDADPHEDLTLNPSIGMGGDDLYFHIWVKAGEIDFV